MPVILSFFNTRDLPATTYILGGGRTPNQTDSDATCSTV